MGNAVNKRTVLTTVALSTFLAGFTGSSITIALTSIGRELEMDAVLLGWVTTAGIFASLVRGNTR